MIKRYTKIQIENLSREEKESFHKRIKDPKQTDIIENINGSIFIKECKNCPLRLRTEI